MSLTPSTMLALATEAPEFFLPDVISGKNTSLADIAGVKGTLVMFICNHCPYVKDILPEIVEFTREYHEKSIGIVAISSNDIEAYPEDAPEAMRNLAKKWQYSFPYLYDDSQEVARAYKAACTPDFYLFNNKNVLVYRGQFDSSRPGNDIPVTGSDLRTATDDLILGNPINSNQLPSVGCNIKWK